MAALAAVAEGVADRRHQKLGEAVRVRGNNHSLGTSRIRNATGTESAAVNANR
jgi:hypothetical protein